MSKEIRWIDWNEKYEPAEKQISTFRKKAKSHGASQIKVEIFLLTVQYEKNLGKLKRDLAEKLREYELSKKRKKSVQINKITKNKPLP